MRLKIYFPEQGGYQFNSSMRIAIEYRQLYSIPSHPLRFSVSITNQKESEKQFCAKYN